MRFVKEETFNAAAETTEFTEPEILEKNSSRDSAINFVYMLNRKKSYFKFLALLPKFLLFFKENSLSVFTKTLFGIYWNKKALRKNMRRF